MGYQPLKQFLYSFDRLNNISGNIVIKAENEDIANKLLKKLKIDDLVSYEKEMKQTGKPPKIL